MFMLCYITFMFHNILCYAILHVMFVINMLCLLCYITCYVCYVLTCYVIQHLFHKMLACYITSYVYVILQNMLCYVNVI